MTIGEIEGDPILNALDIINCRLNSTDVECNNCIDKQNCDWVKAFDVITDFVNANYSVRHTPNTECELCTDYERCKKHGNLGFCTYLHI